MDEIMDWLTAVAAVDERPAVREVAGKAADEVRQLRARDEAAKVVVQAWRSYNADREGIGQIGNLRIALDALAREQFGGRA